MPPVSAYHWTGFNGASLGTLPSVPIVYTPPFRPEPEYYDHQEQEVANRANADAPLHILPRMQFRTFFGLNDVDGGHFGTGSINLGGVWAIYGPNWYRIPEEHRGRIKCRLFLGLGGFNGRMKLYVELDEELPEEIHDFGTYSDYLDAYRTVEESPFDTYETLMALVSNGTEYQLNVIVKKGGTIIYNHTTEKSLPLSGWVMGITEAVDYTAYQQFYARSFSINIFGNSNNYSLLPTRSSFNLIQENPAWTITGNNSFTWENPEETISQDGFAIDLAPSPFSGTPIRKGGVRTTFAVEPFTVYRLGYKYQCDNATSSFHVALKGRDVIFQAPVLGRDVGNFGTNTRHFPVGCYFATNEETSVTLRWWGHQTGSPLNASSRKGRITDIILQKVSGYSPNDVAITPYEVHYRGHSMPWGLSGWAFQLGGEWATRTHSIKPIEDRLPGSGSRTFSVVDGALPPGASLNSTTGEITFPGSSSVAPFTRGFVAIRITVDSVHYRTRFYYWRIAAADAHFAYPDFSNTQLEPGSKNWQLEWNVPVEIKLAYAINASDPYGITIDSGSLPTGLSLDSSTGVISGTPSVKKQQGEVQFKIGSSLSETYTWIVVHSEQVVFVYYPTPYSNSVTEPDAGFDWRIEESLAVDITPTIYGGESPFVFSVESGSLPPGVLLDSTTGQLYTVTPATGSSSTGSVVIKIVDDESSEALTVEYHWQFVGS